MQPTIARQSFRAVTPPATLTPETPVTVLFRGGPPVVDKFDGQDIVLPMEALDAKRAGDDPQWAARYYPACEIEGIPWGAAVHLKERAIVPGTRNPHDGKKALRVLAITKTPTGQFVDKAEYRVPFTDAQLALFNLGEGLDRTAFLDSRKDVTTLDTMASISHVGNVHQQLTAEPDADTLAPPAEHEGLREVALGTREAEAAGETVTRIRRGQTRFKDGS